MSDVFKEGVLIREVLRVLNQKWVSAGDIEGIINKTGLTGDKSLVVKIFIVNQLLEIYRKMPDRYFMEDDHRNNLLEAVQEALDDLIEDEDTLHEQQQDDDSDDLDVDLDFNF